MFNPTTLSSTLSLHERSFAMLQWVRAQLERGGLSFAVVHGATDSATAAQEWIARHWHNLPSDVRPATESSSGCT
jgi:hypothetical protein